MQFVAKQSRNRCEPFTSRVCLFVFVCMFLGIISLSAWCECMECATHLKLPWRLLREKLAPMKPGCQPLDVCYGLTLDLLDTDLIVCFSK